MNRVVLRQLSAWMGFVGVITIISGAISVLFSIATFALGAIPGVISIVLGLKLYTAKQYVDEIIATLPGVDYTPHFNMLALNLNTFFKIQGLLILVLIIILLLSGFLLIFFGLAIFSMF